PPPHKGGTTCQYTHITYPTKESATIASVADIWAEIQRLADENPGFVYRPQRGGSAGCSYLPAPANPKGCIVGAALSRLGVAQELLEAYEGSAAAGLIKAALGRDPLVSNRYELTLIKVIGEVQAYQDAGWPWGEAVGRARRKLATA